MLKKFFLNDRFILLLILVNAAVIFACGFPFSPEDLFILHLIDNLITGLFIIELLIKFQQYGIRGFFRSSWNILDFVLIAVSIPALISFLFNLEFSNVSFMLIFRLLRTFKSFRFLKFVPGVEHLMLGVRRAMQASIVIVFCFIIYIFIVGIFSFHIFKLVAPEYFGDPLTSLYSIFKIFTIEGWFEIPELIAGRFDRIPSFFTYFYFIFILLTGGIFGLSLINSIFVDAMVSDNNDPLEEKIDLLDKKLTEYITQQNQKRQG